MDQDSTQEINRQFALLQEEMRRVLSEPQRDAPLVPADIVPADDGASEEDDDAQLRRIETGLEALRRDADRLRARMARAAEDSATGAAITALRERIEEVSRASADLAQRVDDNASRLGMATQVHREAIEDLSTKIEALTHRRPSRWPLALAVLVGAAMIAALLPGAPDRVQEQVDRIAALIHSFAPSTSSGQASSESESPAPVAAPVASPAPPTPAPTAEAAPSPAATPAPASETPPPAAPSPSSVIAPAAPPVSQPAAPLAAADAPPAPPSSASTQASETAPTPPPAAALPSSITPPATADATPAPPPATEAVAAAPPPPTQPAAPLNQILLRAKGDTWVEVRNRQGGVLLSRVLRAGETWPVPDEPSLLLSTGNAGGLELLVDGVPAPSLGVTGTVRRDVPLVADLVRAGRTGPAPAGAAHPQPAAANR